MKASLLRPMAGSGKVWLLILLLLTLIGLGANPAQAANPPTGTWGLTGDLNAARIWHTATLLPNGKILVAGGSNATPYLNSAELYDPATGTWTATGSLGTPRHSHTATLLPDGRVLVAGGTGVAMASAELYDPITGVWTATGPLNQGRREHTATLLPNGQVLVAGGLDSSNPLVSAELYDPATGLWTATGSLNTARQMHTATLLKNGLVWVAGGAGALVSTELYDPAAGTWTFSDPLNYGRYVHTATLLPNGQVLVAGGIGGVGVALASCELYNPAGGGVTTTGNLATGRYEHTASLLPNGQVLVAGGYDGGSYLNSSELYDPVLGTWRATGGLTFARSQHTATLLPNGVVLAAGGFNGSYLATCELYASPPANWTAAAGTWTNTGSFTALRNSHTATLLANGKVLVAGGVDGMPLNSAVLYDPATRVWTDTGSLATARGGHTATLLPNGLVLVAGGWGGSGYLATAELYDPATGLWTATSSLNNARGYHTATLLPNGLVLVAGGYGVSDYLATAELYNPATGAWTTTGSLYTARYTHTATLLPNGQVLVAGGYNAGGYLASAELYDPGNGLWTATSSLTAARDTHTATLLPNGKVLVAGGYNIGGFLNSAELYDPNTWTWTGTGSLGTARRWHTATLLPNGLVLAAGGLDGPTSTITGAELFDPAANGGLGAWTAAGSLNTARSQHTATLLPNGLVLAAGGHNSFGSLNSAELYGVFHTFNSSAGAGGSISPAGAVAVPDGSNVFFTISPDSGYQIGDVLVDGTSVGTPSAVIRTNITSNHTIDASFAAAPHTITATAGTGGSIAPAGAVIVADGADQTFTITPDAGYRILDVVVDGNPLGPTTIHTFTGVTADHTIQASFTLDSNYIVTVSSTNIDFITPRSAVPVTPGGTATFTIETASASYYGMRLLDFMVDGVSMGPGVTTYYINNVTADHAVTALFTSSLNYVLWATNGPGGTISPYGGVAAPYADSQTFTINPETGYHIVDVLVDGISQGPITSYDFTYIMADGTISATFAADNFTLTASAGAGGTISPEGVIPIPGGQNQTFTITANTGYHVADVLVDGVSVGAVTSYPFTNVSANHTIQASFAVNTYTINATAGANGTIAPSGAVSVNHGGSQSFTITPNTGYHVADVLVDGVSVGAVTSYPFTNVIANHTIQASFAVNTYTINATAGANGTIAPSGAVSVNHGASQNFTFTPDPNYHVLSVVVDGTIVGAMSSYNFVNVLANHTIQVNFARNPIITATAGTGGSISPPGAVDVDPGTNLLFNISPNTGYHILDVLVDGATVGAVSSYNFINVTANHTISATFRANTHIITATTGANGSIAPSGPVSVPDEGSQLFTITPNTGYHVLDVLVDGVSVGAVTTYAFNNVIAAHTIQASFALNTYTITPSAGPNGAITPGAAVSVNSGGSQTFTITPNSNYHVADVLVDGVSVGAVTSYPFTNVTANHTITASFALNTYTITATAETGGAISPSGAVPVNHGGSQAFSITANTGYHVADVLVDGVSVGAVTSFSFSNVISNRTITASFAVNTYTITATAGANGTITPSGAVSVNHGANQGFSITANTGYHVADVLVDGVSVGAVTSYPFNNVIANHTITASFAVNTYTITATAGANGTITPSGAVPVNHGANQGFSITANTGYHVADVLVDGVSVGAVTSYPFNNVTANHTITASFAVNTYTITATAGANGTITPSGAVPVNHAASQNFTFTPDPNYHVLSVVVDGVNLGAMPSYNFVNVLANHTIQVNFARNPIITATAGTGGSISPPGAVDVAPGTNLTFNITPNTGYHILDVLVDGATIGAVSSHTFINVVANHTISASFAPNDHIITAGAGTGGSISPAGAVNVANGTDQIFSITANTGYHVADVLVDGSSVGAVTSYTFTNVTANHTITASFALNTYSIIVAFTAGGNISPMGPLTVNYGADQTFTITPATGYSITNVWVDNVSVGPVTSYTFYGVNADHQITAHFSTNSYTITASAGPGGSISPAGAVPVNEGGSQSFAITPAPNYNIQNVVVDGVSMGPVSYYNCTNVTANHTITATFVAQVIQIVVDRDRIVVPYLGTGQFQVRLSSNPQANVTVAVAWQNGNPNIQVQNGATLTFTPANWNIPQTVTLLSTEETGMIILERTTFQLGASGVDPCQVTALWVEKMPNMAPIIMLLEEDNVGGY